MSSYSLQVIEDCSPFYVRFTFDNLSQIVQYAKDNDKEIGFTKYLKEERGPDYEHINLYADVGQRIVEMLPFKDIAPFMTRRVAIFDTPPGGGCGIHRDGADTKVSFNIVLDSADDLCETTWYNSTEAFESLEQQGFEDNYTRCVYPNYRVMAFRHSPIKRMVARPNEMILFNTDIYHAWQNVKSTNRRRVLTLRLLESDLSFKDIKDKLL